MENTVKTLLCVTAAGLLFIPAVYFNQPFLFIAGAFFDWLPLPTGWMRMGVKTSRRAVAAHAAVTLLAYAIGVLWVALYPWLRVYFLEVWWLAVMAGVYVTIQPAMASASGKQR